VSEDVAASCQLARRAKFTYASTANRTPAPQRPAPAGPNSNAQSGDDLVARMQKLSALHDAGMITDPEFERKRAEILGEI